MVGWCETFQSGLVHHRGKGNGKPSKSELSKKHGFKVKGLLFKLQTHSISIHNAPMPHTHTHTHTHVIQNWMCMIVYMHMYIYIYTYTYIRISIYTSSCPICFTQTFADPGSWPRPQPQRLWQMLFHLCSRFAWRCLAWMQQVNMAHSSYWKWPFIVSFSMKGDFP